MTVYLVVEEWGPVMKVFLDKKKAEDYLEEIGTHVHYLAEKEVVE